ncbi:hypothetical protein [Enhygromyxa salina]|uniref:hypothetical protein n=1 Tax=Enhygromyxa salina TaxID=215803 RepID=UPI000D095EAF|nr:hypothetical protein [Enhygromyxa salina]
MEPGACARAEAHSRRRGPERGLEAPLGGAFDPAGADELADRRGAELIAVLLGDLLDHRQPDARASEQLPELGGPVRAPGPEAKVVADDDRGRRRHPCREARPILSTMTAEFLVGGDKQFVS